MQIEHQLVYRDDLTAQLLDLDLVKAARATEPEYFNAKAVWERRIMGEARRVTWKLPITALWVDVDKGDDANPNVKSRLVARQIRQAGKHAIFAPTPPPEAPQSVLSLATTDFPGNVAHIRDPESERRTQVSAVHTFRAYFNASTEGSTPTYGMLPLEDREHLV